jgi:hypothetical protein
MNKSRWHEAARHTKVQDFGKADRRPSFCKRALIVVSYATASAIVALCIWPAFAGDILAKFNAVPASLTSRSDVPNPIHKANRLPEISFQGRWSAPAIETPGNKGQREPPRTERRIEKIPFSCELAFSRLVSKGNFSTRCTATIDTSRKLATAE